MSRWNRPPKQTLSFVNIFRETSAKIDWERDGTNKNMGHEKGR